MCHLWSTYPTSSFQPEVVPPLQSTVCWSQLWSSQKDGHPGYLCWHTIVQLVNWTTRLSCCFWNKVWLGSCWKNHPSMPTHHSVTCHHVAVAFADELLHRFWESPKDTSNLSPEKLIVVQHFDKHHTCTESGRFIGSPGKSTRWI